MIGVNLLLECLVNVIAGRAKQSLAVMRSPRRLEAPPACRQAQRDDEPRTFLDFGNRSSISAFSRFGFGLINLKNYLADGCSQDIGFHFAAFCVG